MNKLYIGAFKKMYKVLQDDGTIVAALPAFRVDDEVITLKTFFDRLEKIGYNSQVEFLYHRPQAKVARHICIFKKNIV